MTEIIGCDALIFQTLQDLKDACIEAADETSQVRDFEVGVFCGQYTSPLPEDYLERSMRQYQKLNAKKSSGGGGNAGALVSSSGPVNVHAPFEDHEDIK